MAGDHRVTRPFSVLINMAGATFMLHLATADASAEAAPDLFMAHILRRWPDITTRRREGNSSSCIF
jgi:hypothetical protein